MADAVREKLAACAELEYLEARARRLKVPLRWGRDGSALGGRPSRMQVAERTIGYRRYHVEGRHIVDQGEVAWEFFVILDGELEVLRGGETLAVLQQGDFFGEMALEADDRRNASVVAKTPVRLAVMLGRDFREMEEEMPHVAEQIRAAIMRRSEA